MQKVILLFALLLSCTSTRVSQTNRPWNGKPTAVVLTYDDALDVHLTNALPVLDSLGLRATFYISDYAGRMQAQTPGWQAAAAKGHELGNHTVRHPCDGTLPGRDFVRPETDLSRWTVQRMTDDIRAMEARLHAIDGKTSRTFAYPCGDIRINDTAYLDRMPDFFVAARGVTHSLPTEKEMDLADVSAYSVAGQSGEALIAVVKEAQAKGSLLVFLFHGVGGGHGLDVSLAAHRELLEYLQQNEKDIWIAPLVEVAGFIRKLNH